MSVTSSIASRRVFLRGLFSACTALPLTKSDHAQAPTALLRETEELKQLHSMQVQLGDDVVFETAPHGAGIDQVANINPCSKSIVALLLGGAIRDGAISGLNARLGHVAPGVIPEDATDGVSDIAIEDLVTLRAGFQPTSGELYGRWVNSSNWVGYALGRSMVPAPGDRMIYSTGTTHVLGAALAGATGDSLLALTRERPGKPLHFEVPAWIKRSTGLLPRRQRNGDYTARNAQNRRYDA